MICMMMIKIKSFYFGLPPWSLLFVIKFTGGRYLCYTYDRMRWFDYVRNSSHLRLVIIHLFFPVNPSKRLVARPASTDFNRVGGGILDPPQRSRLGTSLPGLLFENLFGEVQVKSVTATRLWLWYEAPRSMWVNNKWAPHTSTL